MSRNLTVAVIIILLGSGLFTFLVQPALAAQPELKIYKTADRSVVTPGDRITYTIFVENLGPQSSPRVWVNDTLPPDVIYVNDTAYLIAGSFQYSVLNGDTLKVKFLNMIVGNHSFQITVDVASSVSDGQILRNTARLNYTSAGLKVQPELNSTATVTVSTPVMIMSKTFEQNSVDPTLANFSVTVNNMGSVASLHVWLNDSLPQGIEFLSYQSPPEIACIHPVTDAVNCTTDDFAPGSKTVTLAVRISPLSPPGVTLVNWVFLNATDQDGSMLQTQRASASFFTQTATISAAVMADQKRVLPGSKLHYYIYHNNTGALAATDVWMNNSLPNGVSLISASPTPDVNSSGMVQWHLVDLGPGSHVASLEVLLSSSLANGTILTDQVTIDYVDAIGRKRPQSVGGISTTVSYDIPSIAVVKIANVATAKPGGQIVYTIFYNNTGSTDANTVTIDDAIPMGIQILSSDPICNIRCDQDRYSWQFNNVIQGSHQILVTARVEVGTPEGTDLVNTATLSYTDRFGQVVGTNFMSVVVNVRTTSITPEDKEKGLPLWAWLTILVFVVLVAIGALWLYMTSRGEEAVIDDVFLLHKDGLLIRHFTRKLNPKVDSDILGGMLIAVQNFVNESFASDKVLAKEDGLDQLKFGKYSILLARGKYVVLAAVVSGDRTVGTFWEIKAAIGDIEKNLGSTLDKWSGDMSQVKGADKYIQDLMAGKYRKRGRQVHSK